MLTNTERQQIVDEVNAGTYGIDEALDDIAAAQKGEEVRKALYAEALVLNREGHAGSTDMIARQQIANLQTSVNGQISTLRTEVGDDIDDLETALNSGLATQNGKIAAQNATIANVVANYNVEYGSTELWASTGETGALAAGTTVTLSEDVSHFDYIDIYSFCGNSNVLDTVPVDAKLQSNAGYALRWVNLSDPGSGTYKAYVRIIETRLHIIGTTLTIDHQVTYRNGEEVNISGAEITQSNRSTYMGELGIMKIVGRKITANTEIEDVRIGADGTEYASAGQAVRGQITEVKAQIPLIDASLATAGKAADAKATGDALTAVNGRLALLKEPVVITHSETVEKGYHVLTFDEPILKGTEVTVIGTAATASNSFTAIFHDSNGNLQNLGTLGISTKKLTGVLEFDAVSFRSFVNGTEWGFTITYGEGVVAEVEDVRGGVNGVIYGSAGEAVRTQVKGIEDAVNIVGQKTLSLLDIDPSATAENWTLKANGLCESNSNGRIRKYSVTPGQLLFLSISKDTYGVYQFQNNASVPASNINNYLVGYPVTEAVDGFVVVPDGATYLIVSQLKTNVTNAIKLADSDSATDIISLNEGIRSLMIQAARPKNLSYNAYLNEPKPLMLLHFSDIHGDSTELSRMVEFADSNSDMIDDTICTGDVLATRWSSDFNYWSAVPGAEKILLAVGNHDVLTDTSGWDWSQRASQADQYTRFFAPFIGGWECSYESGKTYYYKDYDDSKIRLIVLNCMLTGSDDTAQLTWLGTALSGAKAKDYSVAVANHYMIATPTKIPCNFSSIDKGVGSDVLPTAYLSAIQNFIDGSGKFICHIAGHTHWDIVVRSQDYPSQICIVVDALSRTQGNNYSDTQRTNGDKSQDLANVVAFDTSSGVVKVMRVGADTDHYLRQKHCLTIDYATGNIVAES